MRSDVDVYTTDDISRSAIITVYPSTETFQALILGTAVGGTDISAQVLTCVHTSKKAELRVAWTTAMATLQPKPGMLLQLRADDRVMLNAVITEIKGYTEDRGDRQRTLDITARTRDSAGPWRGTRVTSAVYPTGAQISGIMEDVIKGFGVTDDEIVLPTLGHFVPHTNAQMADMTPWEMLTVAGLPGGVAPFINALGQFAAYDKDVTRPADITLLAKHIKRVTGNRATLPTTAVRLKWLDKDLTKVTQQDQALGSLTLTAGFFKQHQEKDIWFSDDRTQRAQNTYMVVQQSINDGLLPVGDESYSQIDPLHGTIEQDMDVWVAGLATLSIAVYVADALIPDGVASIGAGETIPIGRVIENAAAVAILLIMMSLGTGIYEIRGNPYDFVNAINTTEAFDENTPEHLQRRLEINNDFIYNEAHAQQVSTRELLFAYASAASWGVVIKDDPRIEPGDILELPDGARIFVDDYSRDLTRGKPAELEIQGFRV